MQTSSKGTPERKQTRIETHGIGVGPPTPEAVERRACEIAETEGRAPERITEDDRVCASRELHGQTLTLSSYEARSDVVASSHPADMAVETGHRIDNMQAADEQQLAEIEFKEGLREAEHDRMLEAQRRKEGGRQ
jgi:hypothetical protein